jgi:hypothetical protein
MPTMNVLFQSIFQHFTTCFSGHLSIQSATHLHDTTRLDLKLSNIHTFSKSLMALPHLALVAAVLG